MLRLSRKRIARFRIEAGKAAPFKGRRQFLRNWKPAAGILFRQRNQEALRRTDGMPRKKTKRHPAAQERKMRANLTTKFKAFENALPKKSTERRKIGIDRIHACCRLENILNAFFKSGHGAVRLARSSGGRKVASSNLAGPTNSRPFLLPPSEGKFARRKPA